MLIIDGYVIDAEIRADASRTNVVSRFPVEKGADVTDHVRAEPIVLTVDGIVTDTPLTLMSAVRSQFTIINGEAFTKPSHEARARLHEILVTREPITIESATGTFRNMVLEALNESRDASTGDSYQFTATFSEIVLVTNERTTIKVAQPRAAKKVNLGHKAMVDTLESAFGFLPDGALRPPPPPASTTGTVQNLYSQSGVGSRRPI